jgi:hypothetical protein
MTIIAASKEPRRVPTQAYLVTGERDICAEAARGGLDPVQPEKLIAEHAEWRFLDELKRELKT